MSLSPAVSLIAAFFLGAAFIFVGFVMGRSGVTIIKKDEPLSTFESNVLDSYQTWEEEKQ